MITCLICSEKLTSINILVPTKATTPQLTQQLQLNSLQLLTVLATPMCPTFTKLSITTIKLSKRLVFMSCSCATLQLLVTSETTIY